MATGWFANILRAVGQGGLDAISRYDQLHRMDMEGEIRRKQEARLAEQDRIAAEERTRRDQLDQAAIGRDIMVPGQQIDPLNAAIMKKNPFLAPYLGTTPGKPAVAPSVAFQAPTESAGITQMPLPSFNGPVTPTGPAQAFKGLQFGTPAPASELAPTPATAFAPPQFSQDLFGTIKNVPGSPAVPEQTTYLGTAAQREQQHVKVEAEKDRARMIELAGEIQSPTIKPDDRVSKIAELKILAGKQAGSFDVSDLFGTQRTPLQAFNAYQDTVAKQKYGAAATVANLQPKEQLENRVAWMAAQARSQGLPLTLEQARALASYDVLNNSATAFGMNASDSRSTYNIAKADIIMKNGDINTLKTDYTNLVAAQKKIALNNATVTAYAHTLDSNIGMLLDVMEEGIKKGTLPVQNGMVMFNQLENWAKLQSGNPEVSKALNAIRAINYEAAQISANPNLSGALSQKARDELQSGMNINLDTPQQLGVLATYIKESANRARGFSAVLDDIDQEKRAIENRLRGDGQVYTPSGNIDAVPHTSGDKKVEHRKDPITGAWTVYDKVKGQWVDDPNYKGE